MAAPEVAADSCCMVLFGASGDLTRRLVVPALYNLAETGLLPEDFTLLGVDIAERSTADSKRGRKTEYWIVALFQ